MNMKRAKLLTAIGALVVSLALLVGGTYALFTDSATITNHLRSGDMQLTLIRTDYQHMMLDEEGYVADVTPADHATVKNFSNPTNENLFNLSSAQYFVPGSSVSANLQLANSKTALYTTASYTAFDYWITIKVTGIDGANLPLLAEYLLLDVTFDGAAASNNITGRKLGDDTYLNIAENEITIGTAVAPIGTLPLGGVQDFTVKITMDPNAGNDTGNQELQFDLIVNAVQRVNKNTPNANPANPANPEANP